MHFSPAPTHTYYYERHGAGPPVLLLHGFAGSIHNWSPLIDALANGYRLIALDLPGHGRTQAPPNPAAYAMPTIARHIVALLDHLQEPRAHLLGYSMGGRLALYLALHFPQRWRSLTLESASPGLPSTADRDARVAADHALAQFIEQEGIEAFADRWQALPLFATQQELPSTVRRQRRALLLQNDPLGLANSLRGMGAGAQPSLWESLSSLTLPTLLIAGAQDQKFVAIAQQMTMRIPCVRLELLPAAGHTVHLERPEQYHALLHNWLRENDGSPSTLQQDD